MTETVAQGTLELIEQRLSVITKHTDNWTNGALQQQADALTPGAKVSVADMLVDLVHTEASAALNELRLYKAATQVTEGG